MQFNRRFDTLVLKRLSMIYLYIPLWLLKKKIKKKTSLIHVLRQILIF